MIQFQEIFRLFHNKSNNQFPIHKNDNNNITNNASSSITNNNNLTNNNIGEHVNNNILESVVNHINLTSEMLNNKINNNNNIIKENLLNKNLTTTTIKGKSGQPQVQYIVGQERSNLFLVARDDLFDGHTCIELVEALPPSSSTSSSSSNNNNNTNNNNNSSVTTSSTTTTNTNSSTTNTTTNNNNHNTTLRQFYRRVLYVHETKMKCIYASLSPQQNLLAFTLFYKNNNLPFFETYIVEVPKEQKSNNRFIFQSQQKHTFQCIQFIYPIQTNDPLLLNNNNKNNNDSNNKNSNNNENNNSGDEDKRNVKFLFVRDKEIVKMYNVTLNSMDNLFGSFFSSSSSKKGQLVKSIEAQATFVRNFIWFQYDPIRSLLYYLIASNSNNTLNNNSNSTTLSNNNGFHSSYSNNINSKEDIVMPMNCEFKCISVSDKRPNQVFDFTLPIDLPISFFDHRIEYIPFLDRMPWRCGHASPDLNFKFQIVRMENNSICLCHQHVLPSNESVPLKKIDISIFILHHKKKLDFSIPLPPNYHQNHHSFNNLNTNQQKLPTLKLPIVFFSCVRDCLICYLPGWFLQIIDCGKDHDPWPLLSFIGNEFAPNLPSSSFSSHVTSFFGNVNNNTNIINQQPHHISYNNSHQYDKKTILSSGSSNGSGGGNINVGFNMIGSNNRWKYEQASLLLYNHSSGGYIVNLKKGLIFNIDFNFDKLLKYVISENIKKNNNLLTLQFLHLSIIHFKNTIFIERVIRSFCTPLRELSQELNLQNIKLNENYCLINELIFMEYLIGTSFLEITNNNLKNNSDKDFNKYLPISLLECRSLDHYPLTNQYGLKFKIKKITTLNQVKLGESLRTTPNFFLIDLLKEVKIQLQNSPNHIPLDIYLAQQQQQQNSNSPSNNNNNTFKSPRTPRNTTNSNSSTKFSFLSGLFNSTLNKKDIITSAFDDEDYMDNYNDEDGSNLIPHNNNNQQNKLDFYAEKSKTILIDCLAHLLLRNVDKLIIENVENNISIYDMSNFRMLRMKNVIDYTNILFKLSQKLFLTLQNVLYNTLKTTTIQQTPFPYWYFKNLEFLFISLEETNFPIPVGFSEYFGIVGVDVLPFDQLLQYISNDIFIVNDKILQRSLQKYKYHNLQSYLIRLLIQKLKDKEKEIMLYEEMITKNLNISNNNFNILLNYYHSLLIEYFTNNNNNINVNNIVNNNNIQPLQKANSLLEYIPFLDEIKYKAQKEIEKSSLQQTYSNFYPNSYFIITCENLNHNKLPKPSSLLAQESDEEEEECSEEQQQGNSGNKSDHHSNEFSFYNLCQSVEYSCEEEEKFISFLKEHTNTIIQQEKF
ncbi:hypothetical protein ABK040_010909 [Willaertia magna]